MKALQICVNRRSIVHLVALAVAAVLWLGASPAFAQSTTVLPAGTIFTATANGTAPSTKLTLSLGTTTVTCNSTTTGTVPAAPANTNPAGPVCGPIGTPAFSSCTSSLGGTTTVTASGAWTFCAADNGGSPTGTLTIPQNGVVAKVVVLGITCTATGAPNGPVNVTGPFTNGLPPLPTLAFNTTVPVRSSGGFPCPSGTSSSFRGTYAISPNITVGP